MNIDVSTLRAIEYRISEIKSIQREEARTEYETQLEDGHKSTRRSFSRELSALQRDLEALRNPGRSRMN